MMLRHGVALLKFHQQVMNGKMLLTALISLIMLKVITLLFLNRSRKTQIFLEPSGTSGRHPGLVRAGADAISVVPAVVDVDGYLVDEDVRDK